MRVLNFIDLRREYEEGRGFDPDDISERNSLLIKFPNSVIIECDWLEYDTLQKWITLNIDEGPLADISYGKTGYDFGCFEYFFKSPVIAENFAKAIPQIYTLRPHSEQLYKSNGYEKDIFYESSNQDAIILR